MLHRKYIFRKHFRFRLGFLRCLRCRRRRRLSRRATRPRCPIRRRSGRQHRRPRAPFLADSFPGRLLRAHRAGYRRVSVLGRTLSRAERARVCRRRESSAVEWERDHLRDFEMGNDELALIDI